MMMKAKQMQFWVLLVAVIALASSCKTYKPTDFEFLASAEDPLDTASKPIYITSTLPIDSADYSKLLYDVFRIEIDGYPDEIKLYTRVFDSLGHFITNMADPYRKDSTVYFTKLKEVLGRVYNTREVAIDSFKVREFGAGDSIPYNIVLTVDYSGSMNPILGAIFEGTEIFIDLKFDYDQLGLTTFNKTFDVKVPFSQDKNTILNLYRAKRNEGFGLFSAVNDAIYNATMMFESTSEDVPRVLVLFTDGDENYSKKEIGELIEKAKELEVHVFCVSFGYSKDDNLKDIANYTGGKFYKVYTKEQMVSVFRDIYMSLRFYYLISYRPPKYWGWHQVFTNITLPGSENDLIAEGEYDTSDLWKDVGDEFVRPILFDFNKSDLKPESKPIIDEIVDAMLSRPKLKLEIQGHTDNVGTQEYNLKLSEDRAKSVYEALVRNGIAPERLRYRGFGFSKPVASNASEEGRTKNRRTQFVVLAK